LISQNVEVLQTGGAFTDKIGGALTDKIGGASPDKIGGASPDITNSNGNLTETIGNATKGMESFNNITNGLKNIKDVKDIPLLGIILSIIISLSEQKIRENICSRLHNNKDKIIESAIRVFVKEITENNYINDIEIAEVYDSIINNIKKMENVKNLPKPKNSIMNKLKESTTNIDLGFGRELNKFKTNIGKNFTRKNVGGKKNTHKKKSSISKKSNHKSRTNRL
jgi:nitrogenase subunit NifH